MAPKKKTTETDESGKTQAIAEVERAKANETGERRMPAKPVAYNRTLKFGADGVDVAALQTELAVSGHDVTVNGIYDMRTVRAVQQLQRQKGMPASGIIGKHDYAELLESE